MSPDQATAMRSSASGPCPSSAKPASRRRPRRPQRSAASTATPFTHDSRPSLSELELPGPRRKRENRGGATAGITTLRLIIRSPLLPVWAKIIPARTGKGRPTSTPDLFWFFYGVATREFAGHERLDQELRAHWRIVQEEFFFEHGVQLPDADRDGSVPDYDDFKAWRRKYVLPEGRLQDLADGLTPIGALLAAAIRRGECGGAPRDLLNPQPWDCMSVDGTVLGAPSDVREFVSVGEDGRAEVRIVNSRARVGKPRVHDTLTNTKAKDGAPNEGLYNVVAVTKGTDTYTRVVLGVEIAAPNEGEAPAATRLLHKMYRRIGDQFPVLLYDGALLPIHWQEFMRHYGVYCVNANAARPANDDKKKRLKKEFENELQLPAGVGRRYYGVRRDELKSTYHNAVPSFTHTVGNDQHKHHLLADDGALWEVDKEALGGTNVKKLQHLKVTGLDRTQDRRGHYNFVVWFTGQCPHGQYTLRYELCYAPHDRKGHVSWQSTIASLRILPEADVKKYSVIYGRRNHIESYFSWLAHCFRHKDRHAAWGIPAQLFDMCAAAMLHNIEAWAHLAYRHPAIAGELRDQLAAVQL